MAKNFWLSKRANRSNKEIIDYILLMLGAPVTRIEMDTEQLVFCIDLARDKINEQANSPKATRRPESDEMHQLVKEGAYLFAVYMLSKIRNRFLVGTCPLMLHYKQHSPAWKRKVSKACSI